MYILNVKHRITGRCRYVVLRSNPPTLANTAVTYDGLQQTAFYRHSLYRGDSIQFSLLSNKGPKATYKSHQCDVMEV